MTALILSSLTVKHATLLQQLWATTFAAAYDDVHSPENIANYCETNFTLQAAKNALSDPQMICKLAGSETAPLGFYVVRQADCPANAPSPAFELKQIYLMADAYGTGIGKALFEDAVAEVRRRGAKCMWLSVSDKNLRAQRFYQKLRFVPAGRGPDFHVGTDLLTSQALVLDLHHESRNSA